MHLRLLSAEYFGVQVCPHRECTLVSQHQGGQFFYFVNISLMNEILAMRTKVIRRCVICPVWPGCCRRQQHWAAAAGCSRCLVSIDFILKGVFYWKWPFPLGMDDRSGGQLAPNNICFDGRGFCYALTKQTLSTLIKGRLSSVCS